MNLLKDRVAIITGGTGGLGKSVLTVFLREGANVLSTYRKDEELSETKELIDQYLDRAVFVKADVTKLEDIENVVSAAVEKFSRVDILVNIVGGFAQESFEDTDEGMWDKMMTLNAKSAFLCSKAVIPHMVQNAYGRILNIGSRPALKGSGKVSAYGASKAAVVNLTESLADEYKQDNINVNAVIPGTIDTAANRESMPDADYSKWVDPGDIAGVIAFLCSEDARAVNGAIVPVYGKS
jgi:NAD(P)-dependent dehydrogenase (short-subunit alcohol dehydrogenase family)